MDQEHVHICFNFMESITRLGQRKQNRRKYCSDYQLVPFFWMFAGGPPSKATSNRSKPKYKSHPTSQWEIAPQGVSSVNHDPTIITVAGPLTSDEAPTELVRSEAMAKIKRNETPHPIQCRERCWFPFSKSPLLPNSAQSPVVVAGGWEVFDHWKVRELHILDNPVKHQIHTAIN